MFMSLVPSQEVTIERNIIEALTISAHDLTAGQYGVSPSLPVDSIVDSLELYFSANGTGIVISLEDDSDGGQIIYHVLNNTRTSVCVLNINYALDSARNLYLNIGQTAGACTLNGALFVRY